MKILFETYSGRKIQKRFTQLKEAKEYVLRNKAFIKEAKIMEGPLGSKDMALFHPFKAHNYERKSNEKQTIVSNLLNKKDKFGKSMKDYIIDVAKRECQQYNQWDCDVDYDEYYNCVVLYIDTSNILYKDKKISPKSSKYSNMILMPKLTKYIMKNKHLPSESQLGKYLYNLLTTRFENNYKKVTKNDMNEMSPKSFFADNDVEDF